MSYEDDLEAGKASLEMYEKALKLFIRLQMEESKKNPPPQNKEQK